MQRARIEKHESLIHQVINEYLIKEGKGFLKNEFITIMGIKLSPDLSIALIFVSVLNHDKNEFVEKLLTAKKYDFKNLTIGPLDRFQIINLKKSISRIYARGRIE